MENSKIEWTQHTFSPWHGCAKVSAGCKNCYADAQHNFHYSSLKTQQGTCWGVSAPRLAVSADTWKKPLKWNREAQAAGVRARVFCASMADVFEPQSVLSAGYAGQTAEVPTGGGKTRTVRFVDIAAERLRLLRLIYDTPHLDWLLLTKRPEHIRPALWAAYDLATDPHPPTHAAFCKWLFDWADGLAVPANVWLGTSVENQQQADIRVPQLLATPATVRFLSCEPLLSAVELWKADDDTQSPVGLAVLQTVHHSTDSPDGPSESILEVYSGIDWVIAGGESGHGARPMHPDWARGLRDQCQAAGVAFFFKQWGEWLEGREYGPYRANEFTGPMVEVEQFTVPTQCRRITLCKVGKHAAGRLLDGRTWDEVPQGKEVAP